MRRGPSLLESIHSSLPPIASRATCSSGSSRKIKRQSAAPVAAAAARRENEIAATCPLCLDWYLDPVTSPVCGHTFCRSCACELLSQHTAHQRCASDKDGAAEAAVVAPCPLCRCALPWASHRTVEALPIDAHVACRVEIFAHPRDVVRRRQESLRPPSEALRALAIMRGNLSSNGFPTAGAPPPSLATRDRNSGDHRMSHLILPEPHCRYGGGSAAVPAEHYMYCDEAGRMRRVMPSLVVMKR
jgi:hypothetical protein